MSFENAPEIYKSNNRNNGGFLQDLALINQVSSRYSQKLDATEQEKKEIEEENEKLQDKIEDEKKKNIQATSVLEEDIDDLSATVIAMRQEIIRLNELLNQPLKVIAEQHEGFSRNYDKQMIILADWMVSQKAFKEQAIQFGLEKGLSVDDIIKLGTNSKNDVLQEKHHPQHKTNASDSELISKYKNSLLEKLQLEKAMPTKAEVIGRIQQNQASLHDSKSQQNFTR